MAYVCAQWRRRRRRRRRPTFLYTFRVLLHSLGHAQAHFLVHKLFAKDFVRSAFFARFSYCLFLLSFQCMHGIFHSFAEFVACKRVHECTHFFLKCFACVQLLMAKTRLLSIFYLFIFIVFLGKLIIVIIITATTIARSQYIKYVHSSSSVLFGACTCILTYLPASRSGDYDTG